MIFYIIYAVSTNKESLEDKKIRTKGSLYNKRNREAISGKINLKVFTIKKSI